MKLGFSGGAVIATLVAIVVLIPFMELGAPSVSSAIQGTVTPVPPTSTPVPTPTPAPVTEANQWIVPQSNYDAYETDAGTAFSTSVTDVIVTSGVVASGRINSAIGFDVDIPQGATINSATTQCYTNFLSRVSGDIYAWDVDNAGVLSDVTTLPRTAASVSWFSNQIGSGQWIESPDISTVLQEIVDRAGWVENNALTLVIIADTGSNYDAYFNSFDHASGTNRCKLDANFTYTP